MNLGSFRVRGRYLAKKASSARSASPPKAVKRRIKTFAATAYRETILDAAEQLFVNVGYHDAKMSELAVASGVSIGTLYNYFASKEVVFTSLLERGRQELFASLRQVAKTGPVEARLVGIVRTALEYVEQRGALFALYVQMGAITETDIRRLGGQGAEEGYLAFLELLRGALSDLQQASFVRSDIDMTLLVGAIAGALNVRIFHWARGGREEPLSEYAEPMIALFLEGARPK